VAQLFYIAKSRVRKDPTWKEDGPTSYILSPPSWDGDEIVSGGRVV
jgi:hypothetical protein